MTQQPQLPPRVMAALMQMMQQQGGQPPMPGGDGQPMPMLRAAMAGMGPGGGDPMMQPPMDEESAEPYPDDEFSEGEMPPGQPQQLPPKIMAALMQMRGRP